LSTGQVSIVKDRKVISDTLSMDRLWSSEALLSLDDRYWSLANWYHYHDGSNQGMLMIFPYLEPTPVFMIGEPNCLAHIIRTDVMPESTFVEAPISCVGLLKQQYEFNSAIIMSKMQMGHFRPNTFPSEPKVRRLESSDFQKAYDLYSRNVERGHFDADQFNNGIYFGVEEDGQLVSMAGTTVLCIDYRTATIGNVITDEHHRHKGYATAELIELCQQLIHYCYDCICIKVSRGNVGAITVYRRLGFVKKCEFFEGMGQKIRK
jgi:GNAT superfamily N-acetyltransferase